MPARIVPLPPHRPKGVTARLLRAALVAAMVGLGFGPSAMAQEVKGPKTGGLRLETGFEAIADPKTLIRGLHRLYLGQELRPGLSVGQAVYSSATGDAGGAFFWGFELVRALPLTRRLALTGTAFLGGGGGAAQVVGDGLAKRAALGLSYGLTDRWGIGLSAAYLDISGAQIKGPAYGVQLSYRFAPTDPARSGGPDLRSVALGGAALALSGQARSGGPQGNVALVGAEAAFHLAPGREALIRADGGVQGAEGYMQILGGLRQRYSFGRLSTFGQLEAGFGGGGDVDTGGGLVIGAGGGLGWRLGPGADLELGLSALAAPGGEMRGAAASLRLVRVFDRKGGAGAASRPQDWALTLGLSSQSPNAGFHKPGTPGRGTVVMQETSLDLKLSRQLYVTGNAQTTLDGGVAGYAIGLVGLGWTRKVAPRWDIAIEGHIGAAGGGGVQTRGGIVAGLRAEADFALNDRMKLSMALGQLRAVKGAGMAPTVLQIGLKLPFSTQ